MNKSARNLLLEMFGTAFLPAALLVILLSLSTQAFAYDQPWNGNREDITSPDEEEETDCDGGECSCPNPNNTSSPVYTARGYLVWRDTDIALPGDTRIDLKRTYNSFDYRAGLFGRGWVTAQESNIARTFKAVTEGNADGSPKTATEFESVPIWLASYGRRYRLEDTETGCKTPGVLYFTFEKTPEGGFKQVFEDSIDYNIYGPTGALLESYSSRDGSAVYYEYDDEDRLLRQYDSYGFSLAFVYNEQGFVENVTDHAGRVWHYSYDEHGRLTQVRDPDDNSRNYSYQLVDNIGYKQHLLTGIHDNGSDPVLSVTWSEVLLYGKKAMRVASYTEIDGHRHYYRYAQTTHDGRQAVRVIKDTKQIGGTATLESHTYIADAANYRIYQQTNTTKALTTSRQYNENGKVSQLVDERGNVTRYEYNEAGRTTKITERAGTADAREVVTTYWNNTDRIATRNEYGLRESRYTYDDDLRMLTRTEVDLVTGDQRAWTYSYYPNDTDANGKPILGKLASIDGPHPGSQDTQTFAYDNRGQLTELGYPLGQSIGYTYNAAGQQDTLTNSNGTVTELNYDSRNRLVQTSQNGRVASYVYNPQGLIISATDPLGRTTSFAYNDQNQLTRVDYPAGDSLVVTYLHTSSYTQLTQQRYDKNGALIATQISRLDPLTQLPIQEYLAGLGQQVSQHEYNGLDDLTKTTLYGSFDTGTISSTVYRYDPEGRLRQVEDALQGLTNFSYDPLGRLTQVVDPNQGTTAYQYSGWGELLEQSSPDTGTTHFTLDESGNVVVQVDAEGRTVTYGYDALNRPVLIDYEGVELDTTLGYDEGSNGTGWLTSVADGSGTTNLQYNARGLLTQVDTTIKGTPFTTGYSYNDADQLTDIVYPSGARVSYNYDAAGRLASIQLNQDGVESDIVQNVQWRGDQLIAFQHGNGVTTELDYDNAGRLVEKRFGGPDNRLQNQLDTQGQITGQTWTRDGTTDVNQFQYDTLGRLTQDGSPTDEVPLLFTYDPVGNRLTQAKQDGSEPDLYRYENRSNRLQEVDGAPIVLDATGNTLDDGRIQYQYNQANRLAHVTNLADGVEAQYTYNYRGERVRKQLSGSMTGDIRYVYGQSGELLGEYDATGAMIREYIYLREGVFPALTAQIDDNGGMVFVHTDHLGSPKIATDADQDGVWRWISDAFGEGPAPEDPDGDGLRVAVNHRFPGQYFDEETGLHYNYYRDYDPTRGRYVESDPIGLEGGLNTFAYVGSSPSTHVDPDGLRGARPNRWNRFQQAVGGRGLTRAQMLSIYRQIQLNRLGGPRNPDLHEALENLPDPTSDALEQEMKGLNCNSFGMCTVEILKCQCTDDSVSCPIGPQMSLPRKDDPDCFCWKEKLQVFL
ncbi:RHS repeat protein [Proteobacteria bacterium 005FR1]|nr:RHS repeat protein [Proteobacteria bacterium 005FR1]